MEFSTTGADVIKSLKAENTRAAGHDECIPKKISGQMEQIN
jgi:hypothetical protein